MNRTKAWRLSQRERVIRSRRKYATNAEHAPDSAMNKTPKPCSCHMCCNKRSLEGVTPQELRTSDYRQEVNEYFIGKALEYAERIAMIDAVKAKVLGQKHRWVDDLQRFVELSTQFPCSSDPATKTELVKAYAAIHGMEFEEVEYEDNYYDDTYDNSDNYDAYDDTYDSWEASTYGRGND